MNPFTPYMALRKERPRKGKETSPAELLRRFMQKAKPETKARMKGVSPQEFMKMLGVIFDDEEGGGKAASERVLRAGLIRIAHQNPELRKELLPLITACMAPEGPMQGKFEEGKPADPTENMSGEDKKKWWSEHEKNKDQFKAPR